MLNTQQNHVQLCSVWQHHCSFGFICTRIMFKLFIVLVSLHFCSADQSKNSVHQTPAALIKEPGESVQISCNHSNTNFYTILWYKQPVGKTDMTLLGYVYYNSPTVEKQFQDLYNVTGSGQSLSFFFIPKLRQSEDNAVYFCAASEQYNAEAYFGQGTKLTVLEVGLDVTPPTVRILQPSKEIRKDKDGNEKGRTLVCMASGFYPDHVSVSWERNGNKTGNVSTDANATKEKDGYYKITSRLTVLNDDWKKEKTQFKCIVSFFDGSTTINKTDVFTIKPPFIPDMTRGKYVKITQNAKLSYTVLIVKSCLYAALVSLLVWKLKGKRGKQTK